MSVEHYKSDGKDFFEALDEDKSFSNNSNLVNKDVVDDIEQKIKDSKFKKPNKDLSQNQISTEDSKKIIAQAKETLKKKEEALKKDLEKDVGVAEKENDLSTQEKDSLKEGNNQQERTPQPTNQQEKEEINSNEIKPKLKFLTDPDDPEIVYIGRKKSVLKEYGRMGTAFIGKVAEEQCKGKKVHLDGLNPHVVFLDGARGTGKSYLLGVIAEQLAKTNPFIGQIVIDPVGVFWSMKFPNRDTKELKILEEWGLKPEGLKNLKVFVPEGISDKVSKETFNDTFSMFPSLLTPEDWCITFGIDRFSPGGLLLEKNLDYVRKGYVSGGTKENPDTEKIKPKGNQYSLDDIIFCLQNNAEFSSSSKGYKPDSIRALVSRFEAAKSWGIFSDHGTPLSKMSRENQLTVLDTSFLDENITALVIGILARRLLSARKLLARQDAVKKFGSKEINAEQMLEIEIPPTWLYIDEAHTLIPSGNTLTPATAGIIEYVKQGRRPGCSLVFATQQPSAINTKVLSQVDVLISNKLVFNDDIHAIQKRMPAIIPKEYRAPNFIKTLPFATALCGERSEETSRAFILRAGPRTSQHEGRDAETVREIPKRSNLEILNIATDMIYKELQKTKEIRVDYAKDILDVVNIKYKSVVSFDQVLEKLFEKKVILEKEILYLSDKELDLLHENVKKEIKRLEENRNDIDSQDQEGDLSQEENLSLDENKDNDTESTFEKIEKDLESQKQVPIRVKQHNTLPLRINRFQIEEITKKNIKKNIFFKPKEVVQNIVLKYRAIYKLYYNLYDKEDNFKKYYCYVDSVTGEFVHFKNSNFKESKGLCVVKDLDVNDLDVLYLLQKQQTLFSLSKDLDLKEEEVYSKFISKFKDLNLITFTIKNDREIYRLSENFDVPFSAEHKLLSSLDQLPLRKEETEFLEKINYSTAQVQENLEKLWGFLEFISLEEVFWPIWHVTLVHKNNDVRELFIDGVIGQQL